jgi:hypothetical protein
VTDRAVVVVLRRVRETQLCDYVLMFVMRELDRELLLRRRVSKREANIVAWRSPGMANGTDRWLRAAEELRPMTTHASIVIWIVRDVWKCRRFGPFFRRSFVTRAARRLMFLCCVGEL